jgi:hypothetical protein
MVMESRTDDEAIESHLESDQDMVRAPSSLNQDEVVSTLDKLTHSQFHIITRSSKFGSYNIINGGKTTADYPAIQPIPNAKATTHRPPTPIDRGCPSPSHKAICKCCVIPDAQPAQLHTPQQQCPFVPAGVFIAEKSPKSVLHCPPAMEQPVAVAAPPGLCTPPARSNEKAKCRSRPSPIVCVDRMPM